MSNRRTIVALLATIAVLLTLNLVNGEQLAEASGASGSIRSGDPYVVKYLPWGNYSYYRIWSDGQIDSFTRPPENCEFAFVGMLAPPSGHSSVVVDGDSDQGSFIRVYADGRVDRFVYTGGKGDRTCVITGDGSDPFCIGDTDRDGYIDIRDLLNVLAEWGVCEN